MKKKDRESTLRSVNGDHMLFDIAPNTYPGDHIKHINSQTDAPTGYFFVITEFNGKNIKGYMEFRPDLLTDAERAALYNTN